MAEAGHKGAILLGIVPIGGMFDWRYSGEERDGEDVVEFGNEVVLNEPTVIRGGVVTAQGNAKLGDAGVAAAKVAFDAGTKYVADAIFFQINATSHMTPDATSNVYISKFSATEHEASGICKVSMEFKVSGQLDTVTA